MSDPLILHQLGTPADVATFHLGSQADRAPTLVALPVWILLQEFVQPRTWLELINCGLGGLVAYACALAYAMRTEDKQDAGAIWRRASTVRLRALRPRSKRPAA